MEESNPGVRGSSLGWIGAVFLAAALGFAIMLLRGSDPRATDSEATADVEPVVAVLPLLELTGSGDEVLAMALISELQAGLAMIPGIEVRGRMSSRAYTDVNRDAAHAGATLGARVVLDGTIGNSGGILRLALRLVDTADRRQLWSEVFESRVAGVFEWRDSVVTRVAAVLGVKVDDAVLRRLARRSTTPESFQYYASGRFRWAEGSGGDLLEALTQYGHALAADSGFAPTWTALAHTYAQLPRFTRFPSERVRADGTAAARTALGLDSESARAHAVLGEILYLYDHDYTAGRSHLERALALEPGNGETLVRLCELEMLEGRLRAARSTCGRSLTVDPLSFQAAWLDAGLSRLEGNLDRATTSLDSLRRLYPGYIPLAADVAFARILSGDTLQAHRDVAYWVELLGGDSTLARELWGDDRKTALNRLASELQPAASNLAALAVLLGDHDVALDAVETAVESKEAGAARFPVYPEYAPLRGIARYDSLVAGILSSQRDGDLSSPD